MMMLARKSPAFWAVLLVSIPSAVGVQRALAPTRGEVAAWLAAAGFEAIYLSVALLPLTSKHRAEARRIAIAAVTTAIVLNTIADYQARIPDGLSSWLAFRSSFDGLALVLSFIESAPLAGLAFAMAMLLHRLAEEDEPLDTPLPALDNPLPSPVQEVKPPQLPLDKSLTSDAPTLDTVLSPLDVVRQGLAGGLTQAAIAEQLGVTRQRVGQLVQQLKKEGVQDDNHLINRPQH